MKIAIVVSRFNELITKELLAGAQDTLSQHQLSGDDVCTVWVPGAFEIPLTAQELGKSGKYAAIICLGAVIKGSTDHYDYVCSEVSKGIAKVSLEQNLPCIFGVLTTNTLEEALDRAGGKLGNKGREGAHCALEMIALLKKIRQH